MSSIVRIVCGLALVAWLSLSYTAAPTGAAGVGPSAAVVADGATEDATASNNQVKLVRTAGGLVVAYVGAGEGGAQIYLARSRDGARWTRLAQASEGSAPSRLPAVALDGAGRLHVMWTRYDDGVGKIYYRVWAGGWTAPQRRISPANGYAGYPGVAVDEAGRPQVVWYGIRGGGAALYTRHGSIYEIYYVGFDGRTWSPPLLLSTGVPDSVNPAIASAPRGRLFAAWYQYDGRTYQIRYAERAGAWSAPEGVFHTRSDEFNPDLAVDPDGQVSLAWEHHDGLNSTVEYARQRAGRWDGPVALSAGGTPARHPAVAVAPSGIVYVAWDQDDGQIYLRRRGSGWGPILRLTADGGDSFPAVAADGPAAAVAWTHTAGHRSSVDFVRVIPR